MKVRSTAASVAQLVVHAIAFAVCAYAMIQIVRGGMVANFAVWFAGAVVLHDLVLLPVYSLLDRLARFRRRRAPRGVPAINYWRAPGLISGLLLLVYFPLILGLGDRNYLAASGHHLHGYLRTWLEITAILFSGSGLLYGIRVLRARR